ncbi:hypothetical protein SIO70_14140 [Chitinophaga sancti]|uniref:hypothetical protein n=1 Tax=Chitinophaga sancti TaxID=1004 RepID=UPI002A74765C|nr:hypothetical protein [Chitinophaga sancti]WPQ65998.1 hypothetical protein SIO70_14140 [Chitinophaga sancti]
MRSFLLVLFLTCSLVLSVHAQYYEDICSFSINQTPTYGAKIKTNIPFTNSSAMPTLIIEGFDYSTSSPLNLTLTWYVFNNVFYKSSVATAGGSNPPITLANENGKISIFLDYKSYYLRFHVRAFAKGLTAETAENFSNWTVVDSALITDASPVTTVSYRNNYAGTVYLPDSITATSAGKFGVGTLNPRASLDVATTLPDTVTSVLGRLAPGNTVADGTYLGVKSYSASGTNIPMFGLISKYAAFLNSGIIFNKGSNTIGGYLTFLTNDGTEQMRLDKNGNLLIGTTITGNFKLAVAGTIGAKKLQITQSGWADYVFNPGYKLPSLAEVEAHIQANHRLPEIPSEKEISEKGLDVAEMQKLQMQKIEELTLYLIEEHKANLKLQQEVAELKRKIENK